MENSPTKYGYTVLEEKLLRVLADDKELKPVSFIYEYFNNISPCSEAEFVELLNSLRKKESIDIISPNEGTDALIKINLVGVVAIKLLDL